MAKGTPGNGKAGRAHEMALARAEIKQALAQARTARQRLDLLIEHPRSAELLPTLPAEDLYFTVKEIGLSDSVELVRRSSPEQFRSFVDLDAWKRDHLEPLTALAWLRAAATDEDETRVRAKIHHLDVEVLELILRTTCTVHDLQEDEDVEPQGISFRSPEGRYLVEFKVDGADYLGVKRLLDELYAEDPFRTARLLEAVRWEVPSELEETAFRWRTGRMQDLGFPELSEALSYFAYVDPDGALPALDKAPAVPDTSVLVRFEPAGTFFDRAVAHVVESHRAVLDRQLVTVLNAVMVAEAVDPGDWVNVNLALGAARDTLSLGLEHLARGDATLAASLLVGAPLKRVFQVGASLALRLKFRADRLVKSGRVSLPRVSNVLFDRPYAEMLVGVRRKRPQYAEALDSPTAPETGFRPFRDRRDVERVVEALGQAEALAEVFAALKFDPDGVAQEVERARPSDAPGLVTFSTLFLTAIAQELVGEGFAFKPLPAEALARFAEKAFLREADKVAASTELVETVRARLGAGAASLSEARRGVAESFGADAVRRLTEEMGEAWAVGTLSVKLPLPLLVLPECEGGA